MPIINGHKMACEPCIRGHRSTKCTHAKERLMVPVRKPGRPLSICPHPPGKPCGCGGITAAIPRTQKCRCGTDDKVESAPPATPVSESPAVKGSMSPTRRTFQVQKTGPKTNGRKQSFDPVNLSRAGPESYRLHAPPGYNGRMQVGTTSFDDSLTHPQLGTASPLEFVQSIPPIPFSQSPVMAYNGVDYSLQAHLAGQDGIAHTPTLDSPQAMPGLPNNIGYFNSTAVASNGGHEPKPHSAHKILTTDEPSAAPTPGSCCAGKAQEAKANGNHSGNHSGQPISRQTSNQEPAPANYPPPAATDGGVSGLGMSPMGGVGAPMMGTFQQQMVQPMYYAQPGDPTIFTYPAYYGTWNHPILPPQWRQAGPSTMGGPLPPGSAPLGDAHGVTALGIEENADGTDRNFEHHCSCGNSCNCLGCPAHPYNEATQDYVRSAVNSIAEGHMGHHGEHGPANENGVDTIPTPALAARLKLDPSSPPQAQTPSEASEISEDQAQLSASDYLFVTYPFGCEGETASCPCGDDCQCVGCMIHSHLRNGT